MRKNLKRKKAKKKTVKKKRLSKKRIVKGSVKKRGKPKKIRKNKATISKKNTRKKRFGLSKIFQMLLPHRKPKREILNSLNAGAINRLEKIKKEKISPETFEKINHIIRVFLRERYRIKETLTLEEIKNSNVKIRKKTKEKIMYILNRTSQLEYGGKTIPKEELAKLIDEISKIIKFI